MENEVINQEAPVIDAENVIAYCRDAGLDDDAIVSLLNDALAKLQPANDDEVVNEDDQMKEVFGI